jgi:hypothetical protein
MMLTGDSISGVEAAQKALPIGPSGAELKHGCWTLPNESQDSSRVTADQQTVRASRHGVWVYAIRAGTEMQALAFESTLTYLKESRRAFVKRCLFVTKSLAIIANERRKTRRFGAARAGRRTPLLLWGRRLNSSPRNQWFAQRRQAQRGTQRRRDP